MLTLHRKFTLPYPLIDPTLNSWETRWEGLLPLSAVGYPLRIPDDVMNLRNRLAGYLSIVRHPDV